MSDDYAFRPRFAVGLRGYDREQVDAYMEEHARWGAQAWTRIVELEGRVAELEGASVGDGRVQKDADRIVEDARGKVALFVEDVEAKTDELERAIMRGTGPHLDELARQLEDLADRRQSALDDLAKLRESLNDLVGSHPTGEEPRRPWPDGARPTAESPSPMPQVVLHEPGDQ